MKLKPMIVSSLLIALSFIGADIKIMNTIAFDSMPGFFAALFISPIYGAAIAAAGHFFTALLSGFPLSLPVHMIIMANMAVTMLAFGRIYAALMQKGTGEAKALVLAGTVGIIINGPGSVAVLLPFLLPTLGAAGIIIYMPVLSAASAANIILAFLLYRAAVKASL